jgi:hypothetical protein
LFETFFLLEYSPTKGAAFGFPFFLFSKKSFGGVESNAFKISGFRSLAKFEDGT